jgi:hypothetical protein
MVKKLEHDGRCMRNTLKVLHVVLEKAGEDHLEPHMKNKEVFQRVEAEKYILHAVN